MRQVRGMSETGKTQKIARRLKGRESEMTMINAVPAIIEPVSHNVPSSLVDEHVGARLRGFNASDIEDAAIAAFGQMAESQLTFAVRAVLRMAMGIAENGGVEKAKEAMRNKYIEKEMTRKAADDLTPAGSEVIKTRKNAARGSWAAEEKRIKAALCLISDLDPSSRAGEDPSEMHALRSLYGLVLFGEYDDGSNTIIVTPDSFEEILKVMLANVGIKSGEDFRNLTGPKEKKASEGFCIEKYAEKIIKKLNAESVNSHDAQLLASKITKALGRPMFTAAEADALRRRNEAMRREREADVSDAMTPDTGAAANVA